MTEPLDQFFIGKLKEDIELLNDKVIGLQRAMVESRACTIVQNIYVNSMIECLGSSIVAEPENRINELDSNRRKHDRIMIEANLSLANLRGKLTEEALPEDAYRDWIKDIRKRLLPIVNLQKVDSWVPLSSDWGRIVGFLGPQGEG